MNDWMKRSLKNEWSNETIARNKWLVDFRWFSSKSNLSADSGFVDAPEYSGLKRESPSRLFRLSAQRIVYKRLFSLECSGRRSHSLKNPSFFSIFVRVLRSERKESSSRFSFVRMLRRTCSFHSTPDSSVTEREFLIIRIRFVNITLVKIRLTRITFIRTRLIRIRLIFLRLNLFFERRSCYEIELNWENLSF